jgi:hypothetical protein
MELGQYQIQIFVSLLVILGAAFVALICDFLKGNNERLRELTIELKVRREEEQRHVRAIAPQLAAAPERAQKPRAIEPPIATPAQPVPPKPAPVKRSAEAAVIAPKAAATAPRRAVSADAIAAMERGALRAGASEMNLPRVAARTSSPAGNPASSAAPSQPAPSQPAPPAKTGVRTDWAALLARRPGAASKPAVPAPSAEEILSALPAGFHDGFVLTKLVESKQPVTGLVISIGVSSNSKTAATIPAKVNGFVESLIGPQDFACSSGQDEFLLIYPRLNGAEAQRQLSHVAQQLWDFQLRSLGTTSILFSWGGVEVASESLDQAMASATERMEETRRGRKLITMPVRQAV